MQTPPSLHCKKKAGKQSSMATLTTHLGDAREHAVRVLTELAAAQLPASQAHLHDLHAGRQKGEGGKQRQTQQRHNSSSGQCTRPGPSNSVICHSRLNHHYHEPHLTYGTTSAQALHERTALNPKPLGLPEPYLPQAPRLTCGTISAMGPLPRCSMSRPMHSVALQRQGMSSVPCAWAAWRPRNHMIGQVVHLRSRLWGPQSGSTLWRAHACLKGDKDRALDRAQPSKHQPPSLIPQRTCMPMKCWSAGSTAGTCGAKSAPAAAAVDASADRAISCTPDAPAGARVLVVAPSS